MTHVAFVFAVALSLPRFWTVHIDYPSNRAQYERIDKQDVDARRDFYASHQLTAPTVWRITTDDGAYLGLRPRGSLAELEKSALPPDLSKELQAKTAPISETIHRTLRTHHSEIWELQTDLTTFAGTAHRYSLMRTDVVSPTEHSAYETAMKQLVQEAAANGVETVAFFSSYGDGAYHYVFSSENPIKLRKRASTRTHDVVITRLEIR